MTTISQQVIWTALPRGRFPDGSLHVVAFTTPQLSTSDGSDTTLEQFPDFTRWPDVPVSWAVDVGGVVISEGIEVVTQPAPRRDLWEALFPATTLVRSFVPANFDAKVVRSYPVADITRFVRNLYRSLLLDAGTASELPAVQHLIDALDPIDFYGREGADRRAALVEQIEAELAANRFVAPGDPATPGVTVGKAFIQHHDFIQPRSNGFSARPVPVRDFHEYVSVLGHYRELVRLLGLAVDLKVPAGPVDLPPGPVRVQLRPGWVSALNAIDGDPALWPSRDVRPFTSAALNESTFLAAPRDAQPRVFAGRLALADRSRYRLVEVDQDGAAVKLGQLAENLSRAEDRRSLDTPTEQSLPALRSGGIAVAEVGMPGNPEKPPMGGEVTTEIAKGMELTNAMHPVSGPPDEAQIVLDAEDLTTGSRFDVWDSLTGRWNSLSARAGEFNFARIGERVAAADQAIVQPAPTSAADADSDELFLQQTLFNWTGWSLAGHLPGLTIPVDASAPNPSIDLPTEEIPEDFQLGFDFTPARGSLPRLRFGQEYWIRARTADLAGDSIAFGPPDSQPGTPEFDAYLPTGPIVYGRFEPVQTPPLLYGTIRTEGESSEVLVLRSNYDQPPGEVIAGHPTLVAVARHVVPPKVSVRMIEHHGLLDRDADPPVDPETYLLLAERDGVMLPESEPVPILSEVVVDYLPDPLAKGAAFRGLPGAAAPWLEPFLTPSEQEWFDPSTFRLVIRQGSGPPQSVELPDGSRALVVFMAKAKVAKVRLSAFMDGGDVDKMTLWRWLAEPLPGEPAGNPEAIRNAAATGQAWMLTPFRTLTLVHAVRQPLAVPNINAFAWARRFGDTYVTLTGRLTFNRKSTGRVDVHASWPNPVDRGPASGAPTLPGEAAPVAGNKLRLPLVFDPKTGPDNFPIGLHADLPATEEMRHELGDTKHKVITYQAEATTRFAQYFRQRTTTVVSGYSAAQGVLLSALPIVRGSVQVRGTENGTAYPGTGDLPPWTLDADTHVLRFNNEPGQEIVITIGTPLEISYIDGPISRLGNEVTRTIKASARPAAPKLEAVVPTFGWTEVRPTNQIVSSRPGSTLRVYLRRPWWTSGAGEKLGVVLLPGGVDGSATEVPNDMLPYVTQWGSDPAYGSESLPAFLPRFASFPEATASQRGLFLAELPHRNGQPDRKVDVSVHDVAFDPEQDLWYCDIRFDPGPAYQPFVRLALARYQREAQEGPGDDMHLSPVVMADFVQLAPDRVATVVFTSDTTMDVSLSGPTYEATDRGDGPGEATVLVERHRLLHTDPVLGWEPVGTPQPMGLQSGPGGIHWSRSVGLPGPRGSGQYRLVIEQTDTFDHDRGTGDGGAVGRRLVHTDTIVL